MNIKNSLFALLLCLSIPFFSTAQTTDGFSFGLGYSHVRSHSDLVIDRSFRTGAGPIETEASYGFSITAFARKELFNKFWLHTGLSFDRRTAHATDYTVTFGSDFNGQIVDIFASKVESILRAHYIGLPILVQYELLSAEKYRLRLTGGFHNRVLLNAKIERVFTESYQRGEPSVMGVDRQILRQLASSFHLGIDNIIPFSSLALTLHPFVEWQPSVVDDDRIDEGIFSVGLQLGIMLFPSS
ncbi:MAG: outer membrane beta-barrel protein [Bacteroidota bacterium]